MMIYKQTLNNLNMEKTNLIAVYGTLRKGAGNHHHFLRNAECLGEFSSEPVYNLYDLGGFPGLREEGNTSVKMEVYAVDDTEAALVDSLEGYVKGRQPHFYDKKEIETPFGTASVYLYVREVEPEHLIDSGDWFNRKARVFGRVHM